jgi:enoyl-CoA hydratase/carnithine racemase
LGDRPRVPFTVLYRIGRFSQRAVQLRGGLAFGRAEAAVPAGNRQAVRLTDRRAGQNPLLLGTRISAQQALALGLANRVAGRGEAVGEAHELAKQLADVPPQALRETRRVLDQPLAARLEEALDDVLAAETASFDEDSFRTNLSSLRERTRT